MSNPSGDQSAAMPAPEPMLEAALEAVLMVADQPLPARDLAAAVGHPEPAVEIALAGLAAGYDADGRGFELRHLGGGWRYYTREECAAAVERFVLEGQQARLTQAGLETLAVVAYRQPVTRGRVSAIRGVNVDGVMRTLLARGLVEEAGIEPASGAIRYRTSDLFLEKMGLDGLDQLPELAPYLPTDDEAQELVDAGSRR